MDHHARCPLPFGALIEVAAIEEIRGSEKIGGSRFIFCEKIFDAHVRII
jgi:hypothetical protein